MTAVIVKPESIGAMMGLLHGDAIKKRWWHRLPWFGPKTYTHIIKSADLFTLPGVTPEGKATGGKWTGSGDADDFEVRKSPLFGPTFAASLKVSRDFDATMAQIRTDVGTTAEVWEKLGRDLLNSAVDEEVMAEYRAKRVAAGNTNHKKLLAQERLKFNFERFSRTIRRAGIELGWFGSWGPAWNWPQEARPYDWAVDGFLPKPTGHVFVKISGRFYESK